MDVDEGSSKPRRARSSHTLPTVRTVARRAGVSSTTVSRVLQGDEHVAPAIRESVQAAIEELGYRRNEAARSLRLGKVAGLIGVVLPSLAYPFYPQVVLGVESLASERNLEVVVGITNDDPEREQQIIADLTARRVAGVVVMPLRADHSHLDPSVVRAPVVLVDNPPNGIQVDCVLFRDFEAARDVTDRLLAAGARIPAFIGPSLSMWTTTERLRGFSVAMEEHGVSLDSRYIRTQLGSVAESEAIVRELLALPRPPDAIFCANYRNTLGAIRATGRGAANRPLGGFDDFELAGLLGIPLTLVAYDPLAIGRQAMSLLAERIELQHGKDPPAPRRVYAPTRIVEYGWDRSVNLEEPSAAGDTDGLDGAVQRRSQFVGISRRAAGRA